MDLFKDCIPSILLTNKYQITSEVEEKQYLPFYVNKSLSYHMDCLGYAQEMNRYPSLDKKLQYDYLFYSIKKYKRPFKKWLKQNEIEDIKNLMQYYKISKDKAKEVYGFFPQEELNRIAEILDPGGFVKK